ncbi:hypothetical protein LUZ60_017101 [Juncus effusus]|nr:hypothetical protein LUZ60_017101 [Juncus effusus]
MRPVTDSYTNSIHAKPSIFHSPIPYLFAGIGAMMILIAVALVILACSHKKRENRDPEKDVEVGILPLDREPPIFVMVPGETRPSFLAKPLSL